MSFAHIKTRLKLSTWRVGSRSTTLRCLVGLFLAYGANLMVETLRTVEALEADPSHAMHFADIHRDVDYPVCIDMLQALTAQCCTGNPWH